MNVSCNAGPAENTRRGKPPRGNPVKPNSVSSCHGHSEREFEILLLGEGNAGSGVVGVVGAIGAWRCEHPHLRGEGNPVPAGPPIFNDADTGAGGPRRSRSPDSQRQARIPSAESTRRRLHQRTSAVAPLLMHLHLPEFCVFDLRDNGGLPHALPARIVGRCETIVQGYTSVVATYTYIVTVDVTKPQPSQGVCGGVLLSFSLSPPPSPRPPPLSSPLSLPPSLSLFDSRLHLSQGVYGGVLLCSMFATKGAYLMHWPLW